MSSRFYKKKKPRGLMLTSLLDMFTIILIFLIVSFEAEDQDFRLDPDLELPMSSARSVFVPAINVVVNPNYLLVEQQPIVPLTEGRFDPELYELDTIEGLVEALEQEREQLDFRSGDEAIVMIQADHELDYETLYLVMRSSSLAGFARYRLAIMKQ